MAVGPERSLTNPHHGIGVAIYVLIMVQAIGGGLIHKREKGKARIKLPVKLVLHQWVGRTIALLGFTQVPLGLTLYGSPKWLFIVYAVWMAVLILLYFVLNYRAMGPIVPIGTYTETAYSQHGGTVIEDKKKSRFGGLLGPLAAGGAIAALMSRKRRSSRSRSHSRSRSRERRHEVIGSRRSSVTGSVLEEKYERKEKSGGIMSKLFKGAAVAGGGMAAKKWWDRRQDRRDDVSEYNSVAQTPSKRPRHSRHGSVYEETTTVHRMEEGRPPMTPSGPGGPLLAATAISAAESPGPHTPRPAAAHRRDSYDSDSYYNSTMLSPSRRPRTSNAGKGILATIGLGWFAKKMADRRAKKDDDRLDRIEDERIEQERMQRLGNTPSRLTGDGHRPPPRRTSRPVRSDSNSFTSSDLSSIIVEERHHITPGSIPPPPVSYGGGPIPVGPIGSSHNVTQHHTETISMPPAPPDPHGVLHQDSIVESGSENYMSAGGRPHRRHSSRRRREGEAAQVAAAAAAATLAREEEERRRRSRSRSQSQSRPAAVVSPPVSVKVKVHNDKNQNVTLRRLTEEEAALERHQRRRRRADSLSSMSGTDTASRRRYRRGDREDSIASSGPPPAMAPLSPPNPAFAKGKRPKDSAYYSGRPGGPGGSNNTIGGGPPIMGGGTSAMGSPESHGTWSAMSPGSITSGGDTNAADRRRRRRAERAREGAGSRVDFS